MKLTEWERADYKALKKLLQPTFIQYATLGITIAVYHQPGAQFARIATAYCGKADKFNKKRGKYLALIRVAKMESMVVPAHQVNEVLDALLP